MSTKTIDTLRTLAELTDVSEQFRVIMSNRIQCMIGDAYAASRENRHLDAYNFQWAISQMLYANLRTEYAGMTERETLGIALSLILSND